MINTQHTKLYVYACGYIQSGDRELGVMNNPEFEDLVNKLNQRTGGNFSRIVIPLSAHNSQETSVKIMKTNNNRAITLVGGMYNTSTYGEYEIPPINI